MKLVFIHGSGSSSLSFYYQLRHFRNSKALDLPGHPSGTPCTSINGYLEWVRGFNTARRYKDVVLCGHSMGGATVTQFALDHQSLIKGLVLMNPAPLFGRELKDGWEEELRKSLKSPETPAGDMGFRASHVTDDFKRAVMADIARNPVERFIGGRRSMARLNLRDRLSEIAVPTLVMGGDEDITVGVENILAEYQALPKFYRNLHFYHGIGHSPNVEVGDWVARIVGNFSDMARSLKLQAQTSS